MKDAYPIVLRPEKEGFYVIVPDFDITTQGNSIADAMEMARDAIGLVGIDMQDENEPLPKPSSHEISKAKDDIITYVDVDFIEYRRRNEPRTKAFPRPSARWPEAPHSTIPVSRP